MGESCNATPVQVVGKTVCDEAVGYEYGEDSKGVWGRRRRPEDLFEYVSISDVPSFVRAQFSGGWKAM